ncbi:hypothetical protein ACU4GD_18575 [Cupriavidus basilensis]
MKARSRTGLNLFVGSMNFDPRSASQNTETGRDHPQPSWRSNRTAICRGDR